MTEELLGKKDLVWHDLDGKYAVRNVLYSKLGAEGEEFLGLGISVKLELIRELMMNDEIPHDIDFDDVIDLQF